jgi:hypothetical protein
MINSGLNLDFSSFPLTLNLTAIQAKAREQRFIYSRTKIANSSTYNIWTGISSGNTYLIGAWKNASNSQNSSSQLWTISHITAGIQVCLTTNTTFSAEISPYNNPISPNQQFCVTADASF